MNMGLITARFSRRLPPTTREFPNQRPIMSGSLWQAKTRRGSESRVWGSYCRARTRWTCPVVA